MEENIENLNKKEYENDIDFIFIDESFPNNREFCIMSSLIINGKYLNSFEREIDNILIKYELYSLKKIRKEKKLKEVRQKINQEVCEILKKYNCRIISTIILYKEMRNKAEKSCHVFTPILDSFIFLLERFFYSINNENKIRIIYYHDAGELKYLRDFFYNNGDYIKIKKNKYIPRIKLSIEKKRLRKRIYSFSFIKEKFSLSIQIADFIAYAINKGTQEYIKENKKETLKININTLYKYSEVLNNIWSLFIKNKNGLINGYGLKVFG